MQRIIGRVLFIVLLISGVLFSKTLVTVNGHPITDDIIPKGYEALDDAQRAELMEHLIKEELIHAYLLKQPLVHTAEFQQAFQKQKEIAQQEYQKISGTSLTPEQLRNIKGSIALILYQQQQFQSTYIDDNEIRNFYENNRDKFHFPDSIEIANIITPTKSEAEQIIQQLKHSTNLDQDFIQIAKAHQQNGYMGWFGRGMAPEALFNASFQAQPKTLLDRPIQTKYGYHVVYLLNKKRAGELSYEEAKNNIRNMLKQQRVLEGLENKINALYGSAEIVY